MTMNRPCRLPRRVPRSDFPTVPRIFSLRRHGRSHSHIVRRKAMSRNGGRRLNQWMGAAHGSPKTGLHLLFPDGPRSVPEGIQRIVCKSV